MTSQRKEQSTFSLPQSLSFSPLFFFPHATTTAPARDKTSSLWIECKNRK